MRTNPAVRRMVMFKHGVAYLERSGPAEGAFELSFQRDEMNDVLKSLAVWVARGDARVGAVAFEKPEDPEEALARRRLQLAPGAALGGLIAAWRGRAVAVVEAGGQRHEGEVLGLEETAGADGAARRTLVLRTSDGRVALVDIAQAQAIELAEAPSRADLAFLVDRSRAATAGDSRTVRVSLAGRAEDLRISYVIPAPIWRVSYRLARRGDETVVMAWGIVHNPADEDLDEVELTLTTGQPVSFLIDLYNPKSVRRTVVEEESRAAAAPRHYERARRAAAGTTAPPAAPAMAMAMAEALPAFEVPAEADDEAVSFGGGAAAAVEAAGFADRGEFFEYRVASRVSLKRGGSAMVPLLATRVTGARERIWRDGAGPTPDLVLTFKNETGAVLEEGPAVVYDEDTYAGEAMVPYSARGVDVRLAFARDLAVRCRRESQTRSVVTGLRLEPRALVQEERREAHHELIAESDHAEPVEVVFEVPRQPERALDPEHAQPFEETASFRRFRATVPPHGRASVKTVERWVVSRAAQYDALTPAHLEGWLANRFLDRATFDALSGVLGLWADARGLDEQRASVERRQKEAYAKQSKLAEQLRVLRDAGPEGELRLRYVKELGLEQDRVNACEAEARQLEQAAAQARRSAAAQLAELTARR